MSPHTPTRVVDKGIIVDTKTVTRLAISGNTVVNYNWIAAIDTAGLHTLLAEVDPLNNIVEVSDANNNLTNTTNAIGRPDLTPTKLELPINPYTGVTSSIYLTVANNVDAAAPLLWFE